MDAPKWGANI